MTGATQFMAAGMYIQLPEGMTFVYDDEEEAYIAGGDVLAKSHSVADKLQSSTLIKFAITSLQNKEFKKDEGTLASFKVSCGAGVEMGTYTGTLKTIEFSKADKSGFFTMDDVNFTITVGDPSNVYTVTFIADGKTVGRQSFAVGDSIKVPTAPDKRGYTFVSWGDVAPTMPAQDLIYTAEYTPTVYRLRFVADGKIVSEDSLAYGTPITQPAPVEKEGYTFTSWGNVTSTMPAQDLTYTARYSINKYLLTFKLDDGTVVSSDSVEYKSSIEVPPAPDKLGYTFVSWGDVAPTMPAQDLIYTAEYTPTVYRLRFVADGKVVSEDSLAYGTPITQPAPVEKKGYTFVSWGNVTSVMPAQDLTYTARYTPIVYRLRFVADGKVVSEDSVAYGTPITQPAPVEKEGYTFVSWGNVTTVMPAQDLTYTARYIINKYLLTFRLEDGTIVKSDSIEYLSDITTPDAPQLDGYTFLGWGSVPEAMPARDMTFTASYRESAVLSVDSPNGNLRAILQQNPEVTRLTITGQMQGDDFNALLELPDMVELTLPAVNSQNNDIKLGQLSKLLILTTTDAATVLDDNAFEGCNPNLMVYAPVGAIIGGTHCNVIIDGTAENIRLTDGRSMRVSQSFTAKTVSYTRSFTKQTYMNESAGWESITLPFNVQNIRTADGRTIVPFGSTTTGDCNFWLATVGTNGFESATQMQANIPYIIAMPNSSEYKEELNITGDVTFMGQNVTIERTDNVTAQSGLYVFTSVYENNGQTDVYAINDNTYGNYHPGGAFVRGLRAARPFEAYVTLTSGAKQRDFIPIMGVDATSIAGIAADEDASATYYTLDGRMIPGAPSVAGTYLIRRGGKTSKILIKH